MLALPMVKIWKGIEKVLTEAVLGFFALIALTCALLPLFFQIRPMGLAWLTAVQWIIVGIFVLEYAAGFALAPSKLAYLREPLRIFVALTLIIAFASLLDSVPDAFVAIPSLRVLHVLIAIIFGLQAGAVTIDRQVKQEQEVAIAPKAVFRLDPQGDLREASWIELLQWCEEPSDCWYHAENVETGDLQGIAQKWQVPLPLLAACVTQQSYPRVEFFHQTMLLSIWLRSEPDRDSGLSVPVVLLVRKEAVLSISRVETELLRKVKESEGDAATAESSFGARMVLAVLRLANIYAEKRIDVCESALREMERTPVGKARPPFFARAYSVKQELSSLHADLWRLRGVVNRLAEASERLHESFNSSGRIGRHLEYLHTTVDNLRESVISLIDLHINSASFEMTKFMRLLAVVNVLALIPAVAGGLLGMNISGAPWPLTLGQVSFLTILANIFCLYAFAIKGWLK